MEPLLLLEVPDKNSREMDKQQNRKTYGGYFMEPSLRGSNNSLGRHD